MAISWTDSIKSTGTLKVYKGTLSGKWATVIDAALEEFKHLSKKYGLKVKLAKSKDESSADVIIQTSDGAISFDFGKDSFSAAFDGKALKGKTYLVHPNGDVEKAFTFLPTHPQILPPDGRQRDLGVNALKTIAVHELIHACGLENSDHNNEDLFYANPVPLPGDTANGDKLMIPSRGTTVVTFPPLFLNPGTVGKINSLW